MDAPAPSFDWRRGRPLRGVVGAVVGIGLALALETLARGVWANSLRVVVDDATRPDSVGSALWLLVGLLAGGSLALVVQRWARLVIVTSVLIPTLAAGTIAWASSVGERAKEGKIVSTTWGLSKLTALRVLVIGLEDGTVLGGEPEEDRYRLLELNRSRIVLFDLREQTSLRLASERVSLLAWLSADGDPRVVGNPCISAHDVLRPEWDEVDREALCRHGEQGTLSDT